MGAENEGRPGHVRSGGWGAAWGSRSRMLAFVGALVVLVGFAVLVGRIGGWTARPMGTSEADPPTLTTSSPPSVPTPSSREVPETIDTPDEIAAWVWLVIAAVVAILVYLLLRRAWDARRKIADRRRPQHEPDPGTGPQVDEEPPPPLVSTPQGRQFDARAAADAIVSCWVWVEDWAAARGRPRLSYETPTEFLDRVVGHASAEAGQPTVPNADRNTVSNAVTDAAHTDRAGSDRASSEGAVAQADRSEAATRRSEDAARRSAAARILLPLYQRARFDVAALDPESAVRARDAALTVCGKDPVDADDPVDAP